MTAAAALVVPGQKAAPARAPALATYIVLDPADDAMYLPGNADGAVSVFPVPS